MHLSAALESLEADDMVDPQQKYAAAQEAETPQEAHLYLAACARHLQRNQPGLGKDAALARERMKIAYLAGELPAEDRARIEAMYDCEHPFAGPAAYQPPGREVQLPIPFGELCHAWDTAPQTALIMGRERRQNVRDMQSGSKTL